LLSPSDYTIQVEHMTEAEVASQTRYFFGNWWKNLFSKDLLKDGSIGELFNFN
jgi:hypothetical protein